MDATSVQIHHGDCLDVMPRLPTGSVKLILSDLPYGVTARNRWDVVIPFAPLWVEYNRLTDGAVVLTATQPFATQLLMSNLKDFKYEWIWEKHNGTGFLNAKRQPLRKHEHVLVFYKSQPTYNPQKTVGHPRKTAVRVGQKSPNWRVSDKPSSYSSTERYPTSVLRFRSDKQTTPLHPTQKPVALMEYLIKTYTNPGDTVLDSCMGSGTTGVARVHTGRHFVGIESDAAYFAIAKERISLAAKETN